MTAGYAPQRVSALGTRTRAAIESLGAITSADPAADEAMVAVSRLRSTLESDLLPAVRSIEETDPLAGGSRSTATSTPGGLRGWILAAIGARLASLTDEEMLDELVRLEIDAPYDEDFQPDMDDPFWLPFEALALELASRAADDDGFADLLVERSSHSFLIPMTVRFATFQPALVGRMLREVTRTPSAMVDLRSNYQARGAEGLLRYLTQHPAQALEVLDESMLKELIEWPTVDGAVVGTFLSAAMQVPFRNRNRLPDAHVVLQDLVALSNRRLHETGFPPHLSPEIARIVVQYVPFFMTSLGGYADVHLKDFDFRDVGSELGSYPEVLDLFGALMRDPASLDILLASIPGLAVIGAGDNGPLGIGPDDVADYVDTLGKAAKNEQIEVQLRADRNRRDALVATDIAFGALRVAGSVMGPLAIGGMEVPLGVLEDGTTAVVEWMTRETDLGIGDVRNAAFVLVVFGLGTGVLRSRAPGGNTRSDPHPSQVDDGTDPSDDAETIAEAEDILERIETRLADGAPIGDLAGLIDDFGRLTRSLDDDRVMDILDDDRVLPPDLDVAQHADTE